MSLTSGLLKNIPTVPAAGDIYFATDQARGQQLYLCDNTAHEWYQFLTPGYSGMLAFDSGGTLDIDIPQAKLLLVGAGTTTSAAATFTGTDTTTEGSWAGKYGTAGYAVANGTIVAPVVFDSSASVYVWANTVTDVRAPLTNVNDTIRTAACWRGSDAKPFSFSLNLTDGKQHRVAVYCMAWDTHQRVQTITVYDAVSGVVLSQPQTISGFHNGIYCTWGVTGNVTFRITLTSSDSTTTNALMNAVFID